jgi:conjugal transfer/entry exclusion protein
MSRTLSMIGLLIAVVIGSFLVMNQLKSSTSKTENTAPTTAIDKAQKAAETVEKQNDQLQKQLNQPEQK